VNSGRLSRSKGEILKLDKCRPSYASDLKRIRKAREDAIRRNNEGG